MFRTRLVPILALATFALLLSTSPTFAQWSAWFEGTIRDASTGSPIAGVYVKNLPGGYFTFSDQNGYYKCPTTLQGGQQIWVWHPDYLPAPRFKAGTSFSGGKIRDWNLSPISITERVFDTFSRPDTNNPLDHPINGSETTGDWCVGNPLQSVGTTEDPGHYPWGIGWIRTKCNIKNQALELPIVSSYDVDGPGTQWQESVTNNYCQSCSAAGGKVCGSWGWGAPWTSDGVSLGDAPAPPNFVYPDDFPILPNDFEFTAVIKSITWQDYPGIEPVAFICWHQMPYWDSDGSGPNPPANILEPKAQYDFGPSLAIYPKPGAPNYQMIQLSHRWYGPSGPVWTYIPETPIDWNQPHTFRIRVQGYHVLVWMDDNPDPIIKNMGAPYNRTVPAIVQDDKTWRNDDPNFSRNPGYIGFYRGPMTGIAIDSMSVDIFNPGSGDLGGRITDEVTGKGIKDARVYLTPTRYQATRDDKDPAWPDEDGYFEFFMVQPGHYDVLITADGYESKTVPLEVVGDPNEELHVALKPVLGTIFTVTDDFDRMEQQDLGTTTDPLHLPWDKSMDSANGIMNGMLRMDNNTRAGVSLGGGFLPADFDASVTVKIGKYEDGWAGIAYRQGMPGSVDDWNGQSPDDAGYVVKLNAHSADEEDSSQWNPERFYVSLFRNGVNVATNYRVAYDNDGVPTPNPISWDPPKVVRVKAVGNHHQVWVDGEKLIDVIDDAKLTGGYFSLVRDNCGLYFDDLSINVLGVGGADTGEVKDAPIGSMVQIQGPDVWVSGAYRDQYGNPEFFYMEDADRVSGLKIVSPEPVSVGNHAWIIGTMNSADGEKFIEPWRVVYDSADMVTRPLGMPNRSNVPAVGLSNLGLLTKVWGKVLSLGPAGAYCYVDDGTTPTGIKVYIPGTIKPTAGKFVSCIGVSSMDPGGVPVIRMRDNADLKQYN